MRVLLATLLAFTLIQSSAQDDPSRGYIVSVGELAPDFEFTLMDGSVHRLSEYRGQVVLLQFTASWCGVCRKEMPHLESEVWQEHREEPFILIGIDREEEAEIVRKFIDATGVTYPMALDTDASIYNLFARRGSGITRNVLIDREGRIVFLTRLYDEAEFAAMKEQIELLLGS
ncbi:MAG: TlpA family protein disulfide reductase [Flavobacteriales bacterium]|nr:TlpA family protein disulfide reductase [Flavobacteriales bacterium]